MDTMVIYQIYFFLFLWNGQITNSITPMKMFCGTSWPYWSYIICEFLQIRIVTMVLLDYHSVILYFYRGFAGSSQCRSERRNVDHPYCGFLDMLFFLPCCVVLIAIYLPGGVDWLMIVDLTMIMCRLSTTALFVSENYIVCFMRLDRFNIQIR